MTKRLVLLLVALFSLNAMADREWTLLLYLNGHNDLDTSGVLNLNQLESVGSTSEVSFVVQWASLNHPNNTKRLLIEKDTNFSRVTSPVVEDIGKTDMGDPAELKEFLLWGMRNYPAKKYFVAVWNHGSGWHSVVTPSGIRPLDISFDDLSGHAISTAALGKVLQEVSRESGNTVDIYGSDACLMGMGEVAGEMFGAVDYFIGSEDNEPADGWPYDKMAEEMVRNPTISPRELSSFLVDQYVQRYDGNDEVTLSVFDMQGYPEFERTISDFADGLVRLSSAQHKQVLKEVGNTLSFDDDYGDVSDFMANLSTNKSVNLSHLMSAVSTAIQDLVVANSTTSGLERAQGLTLWMPKEKQLYEEYKDDYKLLRFARNTGWQNAIESYLP